MKIIAYPNQNNVISEAGKIIGQPLPPNSVIVEVESLDLAPQTAARLKADGTVEIVANFVGSGPWYDQQASTANRLVPIEITEYGVTPAETWAMEPRPETTAERRAREKAEAEAAAAAEAARLANLVLSPVAIRLAANQLGVRDLIEAAVAAPETPKDVKDFWEYALEYKRSHPLWVQFAPLIGKTEADIDALFAAGDAIMKTL